VVAHAVVLFLFSSVALQHLLVGNGLPPIPLIPVSSSQAIVGAVIGIAALKGARGLRRVDWGRVVGIAVGWVATPVVAGILCFFALFFMQNVFDQTVAVPVEYELSDATLKRLEREGVPTAGLEEMRGRRVASGKQFLWQVGRHATLTPEQSERVLAAAEIHRLDIAPAALATLDAAYLGPERTAAVRALEGQRFDRRWKLEEALLRSSPAWRALAPTPANQLRNKERRAQLDYLFQHFQEREGEEEEGPRGMLR
jgi:PiT family inorganic phosphate transporter